MDRHRMPREGGGIGIGWRLETIMVRDTWLAAWKAGSQIPTS
jgi:hypothetical protein